MFTIPFISTNTRLFKRLKSIVAPRRAQNGYDTLLLTTPKSAEDFLVTAKPEVIFVNFSDNKINAFQLLETMPKDLWLLHGSIVALCKKYHTVEQINAIRDANILVSLSFADLEKQLPGILNIIRSNRPLISRRSAGNGGVPSGSFALHNNLFEATCYINLICNYLYNSNRLPAGKRYFFHLALYEMLINAIEHGNCGISYDEKSRFLERGGCASDLIQKKCADPAVAAKMVTLNYALHPSYARFVITDEGSGFDWRTVIDAMHTKDNLRLHGRGILITLETVRFLSYNEKGNEVTFEIDYASSPARAMCRLRKRARK
ncbi:MAG: ATP-binding protein [Chitinispirillaceae bacterium]|nr:ATP-binding protein [Chitinispirillaceae bacterium]